MMPVSAEAFNSDDFDFQGEEEGIFELELWSRDSSLYIIIHMCATFSATCGSFVLHYVCMQSALFYTDVEAIFWSRDFAHNFSLIIFKSHY
jgi:hypothetical protein